MLWDVVSDKMIIKKMIWFTVLAQGTKLKVYINKKKFLPIKYPLTGKPWLVQCLQCPYFCSCSKLLFTPCFEKTKNERRKKTFKKIKNHHPTLKKIYTLPNILLRTCWILVIHLWRLCLCANHVSILPFPLAQKAGSATFSASFCPFHSNFSGGATSSSICRKTVMGPAEKCRNFFFLIYKITLDQCWLPWVSAEFL